MSQSFLKPGRVRLTQLRETNYMEPSLQSPKLLTAHCSLQHKSLCSKVFQEVNSQILWRQEEICFLTPNKVKRVSMQYSLLKRRSICRKMYFSFIITEKNFKIFLQTIANILVIIIIIAIARHKVFPFFFGKSNCLGFIESFDDLLFKFIFEFSLPGGFWSTNLSYNNGIE